jgi:hypothetical protein
MVDAFLVPPSSCGVSLAPIVIFLTSSSFMNLRLVISATSTAVAIARPYRFNVASLVLVPVKLVMTTIA